MNCLCTRVLAPALCATSGSFTAGQVRVAIPCARHRANYRHDPDLRRPDLHGWARQNSRPWHVPEASGPARCSKMNGGTSYWTGPFRAEGAPASSRLFGSCFDFGFDAHCLEDASGPRKHFLAPLVHAFSCQFRGYGDIGVNTGVDP